MNDHAGEKNSQLVWKEAAVKKLWLARSRFPHPR